MPAPIKDEYATAVARCDYPAPLDERTDVSMTSAQLDALAGESSQCLAPRFGVSAHCLETAGPWQEPLRRPQWTGKL